MAGGTLIIVLLGASAGAAVVALTAQWLSGRQEALPLTVIGSTLGVVAAVLAGNYPYAVVFAAITAVALWMWGRGGRGGKNWKRLKSFGRRFTGVRRTAPT